ACPYPGAASTECCSTPPGEADSAAAQAKFDSEVCGSCNSRDHVPAPAHLYWRTCSLSNGHRSKAVTNDLCELTMDWRELTIPPHVEFERSKAASKASPPPSPKVGGIADHPPL